MARQGGWTGAGPYRAVPPRGRARLSLHPWPSPAQGPLPTPSPDRQGMRWRREGWSPHRGLRDLFPRPRWTLRAHGRHTGHVMTSSEGTALPLATRPSSVQSRHSRATRGAAPGSAPTSARWPPSPAELSQASGPGPGGLSLAPQRPGGGIQMRPGSAPASRASSCRHRSCSRCSVTSRQASWLLSAPITSAARSPGPAGSPASLLTSRWGPWGWAGPPPRSQACRRAASSWATASCVARRAESQSGPWPPTCNRGRPPVSQGRLHPPRHRPQVPGALPGPQQPAVPTAP